MKKKLICLLLAAVLIVSAVPLCGCGSEIRSEALLLGDLNKYNFLDKCVPEGVTELSNSWYSNFVLINTAKATAKSSSGSTATLTCSVSYGNEIVNVDGVFRLEYDTSAGSDNWRLTGVTEDESRRYVTLTLGSNGWSTVNDAAFYGNELINEVVIGNGIGTIGNSAFMGCPNLVKVSSDSENYLTELYPAAFQDCTALTAVELPPNLEFIYFSAFEGCTALNSVTFDEWLKFIDKDAFKNCTALTEVILTSVQRNAIAHQAFIGCTALKKIHLTELTVKVETDAFTDCGAIDSVTVDSKSEIYKVENRSLVDIATGETVFSY